MNGQAKRIIAYFGGAPKVAEIVKVDVSQVYRWDYPKSRGGTDGLIPSAHQQALIDAADKNGEDIRRLFFDEPRTKMKRREVVTRTPAQVNTQIT